MAAAVVKMLPVPLNLSALETKPLSTEVVRDLVHELRQPLSTIESLAYYLEMTLPAHQLEARHLLVKLQEMVEQTDGILTRAVAAARTH